MEREEGEKWRGQGEHGGGGEGWGRGAARTQQRPRCPGAQTLAQHPPRACEGAVTRPA